MAVDVVAVTVIVAPAFVSFFVFVVAVVVVVLKASF